MDWIGEIQRFQEVSVSKENYELKWEYLGEGYSGDYSGDEDDKPLLRFSVSMDGEEMEDASYCTLLPVNTSKEDLERLGNIILSEVFNEINYKRRLEEWSWADESDLEFNKQ